VQYDFDTVCDRLNTNCAKWDALESLFGSKQVIPMWVADMDFPVAKPIVEALKKRAGHEFYGYTQIGPEVIQSVVDRLERKFAWKIKPEWVVFTPGVIPALNAAVKAFTHPGDEVVIQPPVYYPFFGTITNNGCQIVNNPLKLINGRYEMDLADLKQRFAARPGMHPIPSRIKALILCNPHNPVGRLWQPDELKEMGRIVIENGALVLSDEIHCELLFQGHRHTPFATLSAEFEQNCLVCMSPSKTFSLAGLGASSIIIPNRRLREEFLRARAGIQPGPNLFALTALEAAYREGDDWLRQLLVYLQQNLDYLRAYFQEKIPRIRVIEPQGTYLVWLDCRGLNLNNQALREFMRQKALVGFDDGFLFGAGGDGFQRMNIACPRPLLNEALDRIAKAVNALQSKESSPTGRNGF
jgi:cystathionine beta-lyase